MLKITDCGKLRNEKKAKGKKKPSGIKVVGLFLTLVLIHTTGESS